LNGGRLLKSRAVAESNGPNIFELNEIGPNYLAMQFFDALAVLVDTLSVNSNEECAACRLDIPAEPALWRLLKHKVQRDFAGH
jgi:hypothetical protein